MSENVDEVKTDELWTGAGRPWQEFAEHDPQVAEDVTKAADRLAQEVGALLDGPPNGASWHLRRFLAQWASVQQALTDYWEARKP